MKIQNLVALQGIALMCLLASPEIGAAQDSVLGAPFRTQNPSARPSTSQAISRVFTIECEFAQFDYKLDFNKLGLPGKRSTAGRDTR
jgi:hypothetical protein